MKPQRASAFADAVPIDGRGHRSIKTLAALACRDHLLRKAAHRFCVGMSDRQAAATLHTKLSRYMECAWRRERTADLCPVRHRGTISEVLWMILKTRDVVPSEMTIRRAISFRDPV